MERLAFLGVLALFFLALPLALASITLQPGNIWVTGNNTTILAFSSGGHASNSQYELWLAPSYFWPYPPRAFLEVSPESGSPGTTFIISGSKSFDPDGGKLRYIWTYQTGSGNATTGETYNDTISLTYNNPGLYSVWLTIIDDENMTGQNYTTIRVCTTQDCPDPAVTGTDIYFDRPSKVYFDGEVIHIKVKVNNLGSDLPSDLLVIVKDLDANVEKKFVVKSGDLQACSPVNGGEYYLTLNLTADYVGHSEHRLQVILDPNNAINECDESNNVANATFYVYPGSNCGIDVTKHEICAYSECRVYYEKACSFSIRPSCCNEGVDACCASCNGTDVSGYIANPEFGVSGSLSSSGGNLEYSRSGDQHRIEFSGKFWTSKSGVYTLSVSGSGTDGSQCYAKTEVMATPSGHESDWPDIAVENIEIEPTPLTGLKSNVYAVIANKGKVPANVSLTYIIPEETGQCTPITRESAQSGVRVYTAPQRNLQALIVKLAPGEEKKINLNSWTPREKGIYCIFVSAYPTNGKDYDYTNNQMQKNVQVGFGRKITKGHAIPEYPGITAALGILLALGLAYLVSRRS